MITLKIGGHYKVSVSNSVKWLTANTVNFLNQSCCDD